MLEKSKVHEFLRGFVNIWNILRFILILICFVWFCINATKIVQKFLEYNTIVMVEYKQPDQTDLPAITVCAHSFIYDQHLKQKYNDSDNSLSELRDRAMMEMSVTDIFTKNNISFKSLVIDCKFYPNSMTKSKDAIPCNQIVEITESINEGKMCFTIFSQLNISRFRNDIQLEYEMNPFIEILLVDNSSKNLTNSEMSDTSSFTLHSPNIIPTRLDYKYYVIYNTNPVYYDIRFTKQITYLKPSPYKTNCTEYGHDNGPGQRSRGDCLNKCIIGKTFENNCFSYFSIITKDHIWEKSKRDSKICTKKNSNYTKYANARRECIHDCQMSCIEEYIEIGYADYYIDPNNMIVIRSDSTPYTIVYHDESMGEPELIGNLGGHAHIWLGLSALKIFNVFVHLVNRMKRVFFK